MTTIDQEKRAKKLEQVRALLAKADGTNFPEEADSFRAKADKMMTAFAIEQWMVDAAQDGVHARPKPEVRDFDFSWWSTSTRKSELWMMFHDVAFHCRCVIAVRGYGSSGYRSIPVIGLPSDLDYMDMLFTHLMLQMGKQLEPKPDPNATFPENAYKMRAAGMARPRIAKLLYDMDMIPGTHGDGFHYYDGDTQENDGERIPYAKLAPNKEKSLRAKVRVAGEGYAKLNGLDPTTTVSPQVWQRSFSQGFVSELNTRLVDLRRQQDGESTSDGVAGGVALAVRDIRQIAMDMYAELWPEPKEEVEVSKRGRSLPTRELKHDHRAYRSGKEAGRRADIAASPGKGLRTQKELPR